MTRTDPHPATHETADTAPGDAGTPASPAPAGRRRRWWIGGVLGLVALVTALLLTVPAGTPDAPAPVPDVPTADPLGAQIAALQQQLARVPGDAAGWAQLGLGYVQEAKNTVNPMYYPKADGALTRSLQLLPSDNADALAGQAALRAAQHRFSDALALAQQAVAIAPGNSTIYGTLADALTQLGRYDEARAAVQQMLDLHPGVPSFARASYVYELAGDVDGARAQLQQALTTAASPTDVAFCRYYLAELAWGAGDPAEALHQIQLGNTADPRYPDLLEGQAKAEAALGQQQQAVADYAQLVASVPLPQYLIEAGEYLESIGRTDDAQRTYQLFDAENRLFTSNGVALDTDPTLFYADHGDPAQALRAGEAGIKIRPFLEMDDAYAWALHVNHRDAEALTWSQKATATGMRNALFLYHRGMIENASGQTAAARTDLTAALAINPYFNPLHAPRARATLTQLGGPR